MIDEPRDEESAEPSLRETITEVMREPPASDSTPAPEATPSAPAGESEAAPAAAPDTSAAAPAPADDGRVRRPDGKFVKKPATSEPPGNGASVATGKPGGAPAVGVAPAAPAAGPISDPFAKAPQAWKPQAREKWAGLPPEIRQEVYRRERETAQVLQQRAESHKFHTAFNEMVRPYEAHIRAEGADAFSATKSLFDTAMKLRVAPPQERARTVAQIIQSYGVDPGMVGAFLQGQVPQGSGGQQAPYDPRVDQLLQEMQSAKRQHEQTIAQRRQAVAKRAEMEVQKFAESHEFYGDVYDDMADLMEVSAKRGVDLNMEAAYTRAVNARPEIAGVLREREQRQAATKHQVVTQQRAAKSVRSTPSSAPPSGKKDQSIRETIMESMEEVQSR